MSSRVLPSVDLIGSLFVLLSIARLSSSIESGKFLASNGTNLTNASATQFHCRDCGSPSPTAVKFNEVDSYAAERHRIIDGEDAVFGEFPFHVSLQYWKSRVHSCGGSLLTPKHVLTACHCLGYRHSYYMAFAGSVDLRADYLGQTRDVKAVKKHPRCKRMYRGHVYDIGMVFLSVPFVLIKGSVEIIELPEIPETCKDRWYDEINECVAIGFGSRYTSRTEFTPILQKVHLQVQNRDLCQAALGEPFHQSSQICTLGEGNKDACKGDSGGALLCGRNNSLRGVASWGIGCGRQGVPGVWARVDAAEPWIRQMMNCSRATPRYSSKIPILTLLILSIKVNVIICKVQFYSQKHFGV